ncbi:hypothetical protein IEQ34_015470 [Dendrobium chrysotoxum]|uniref:Uncharacterized protein n=1 Tax=Dendrobium chrysotoxum TaxID=161865 RepID=A0AAV7GIG6_DENCH|nr:hypothetical protein IEQ34_015470 [Dendrobium chrysotoxum]
MIQCESFNLNTGKLTDQFCMVAKKVDALEERFEGEMSQIKATMEDRLSFLEGKVSSMEDSFRSSSDDEEDLRKSNSNDDIGGKGASGKNYEF